VSALRRLEKVYPSPARANDDPECPGAAAALTPEPAIAYAAPEITVRTRGEPMQQMRFVPGQTIFSEGDPSDCAYTIRSGRVEILKAGPDGDVRVASSARAT
jgi:hypothetical protein